MELKFVYVVGHDFCMWWLLKEPFCLLKDCCNLLLSRGFLDRRLLGGLFRRGFLGRFLLAAGFFAADFLDAGFFAALALGGGFLLCRGLLLRFLELEGT